MIYFNYKLPSYSAFLHELAEFLHAKVENNYLPLPEEIGSGFFRVVDLGGIDALIYRFTLNKDFVLKREKEEAEFYTLVFDEFLHGSPYNLEIDQDPLTNRDLRPSAIYLTSFLYDVEYIFHKDIFTQGLRVFITKDWMKKYLHLNKIEDVLEKYIDLKAKNIWYKPIDAESKELLQALLNGNDNSSLLYYQNKALRIVEIFFDWLSNESKHLSPKAGISRTDIEAVQQVEAILTNDQVVIPPTIKELSRKVAMSESKLKKIFKAVYELPVYEYFQRHRMQKARTMLLSGNYSIKDVGYTLGYSNLSNFTLAFKKEFGRLPSDLVKQVK